MSLSNDPRAAYWNETYLKYWKERVAETGGENLSKVQQGDAKTEGDWVYERVFANHPFRSGSVLDVGCAWGRMFPIFFKHGLTVSGVDISDAMIKSAKDLYSAHGMVEALEVSSAEQLPFPDASFDNLVCVAVFDATYQELALAEFLRVLKPGGRLYLTGKSDSYAPDDSLALAAEKGARAKGHPNYFTEVDSLVNAVLEAGCKEIGAYGFPRRGDFSEFAHKQDFSTPIYEWFMILESPNTHRVHKFAPFSSVFSRNFLDMEPSE